MARLERTVGPVAAVLGGVALVGVAFAAATAATAVVFARRVVIPEPQREDDLRIDHVDLAAREVLLTSNPETRVGGRYALWFEHDSGHARLGEVIDDDGHRVRRRIESVDFGRLDRATRGRLSGWYHLGPWEVAEPYRNVVVETPLGPAPAWFVPAADASGADSADWVVQVHGRGAKRHEALRAIAPAHEAGWSSLLVSYRNDGEAPESEDRRYGLGGTEWEDVVAAVRFAVAHGARRIVLMGWSMGGSIVLQTVFRSAEVREHLVGVILESPAVDWPDILRFQGRALGWPDELGGAVARVLSAPVAGTLTGLAAPIDLEALDAVARADELDVPILLMHSEDDGFVPIDGSRRLATVRPDLVQFEVFDEARHTRLWNFDPERWTRLIRDWLAAR
ncbi:alpha/beta hydrolase family protein [Agromyces aurantiacus]|uniref:Alpha/beta hydrolase family protein n=1 Tax=Agromyces aurantiacus TaxID=165814 RepID=A0ABV9R7N2_9MICO|nr:alpha/beta hydrolase [Agromyces aurantiacus]MBM7504944.1 alpha-beta hydrolase superfamily lysophospholipase [Agromyces aurantiacus]